MIRDFDGAKAAVFVGQRLLVYLRDDRPDIPYPAHWDFPGGGREGDETPEQTLRREVFEEFGLTFDDAAVHWKREFRSRHDPDQFVWFFVLTLPESVCAEIRFGDEGQRWALMSWEEFAAQENAVPSFAPRLKIWCDETGGIF